MEDYKNKKPLGDRVLIETTVVEKTASGIILQDSTNEAIQRGKIVAVGNGLYSNDGVRIPMECEVGDTVLFQLGGMGAQKIKLGTTDYIICREQDLLLITNE